MTDHSLSQYPPSLVRSWLEMELTTPGMSKSQALRDLNEAVGAAYRPNRLYEWLAGTRAPDRATRNYMLRCVIERVLYRAGGDTRTLDDATLDAIADALS